jgi:peptide/nickel transport system substrate-binding protein
VAWTNPDELTWDFQIRTGVAFHSGGTLEPEDVVFSLERARTQAQFRSPLASIESIELRPDRQVRIHTRMPDATLLSRLWKAWVVSRRFVTQRGEAALGTASAGTGPYVLRARTPTFTEVEAFPGYWRGPASVARVRFVARGYGDPAVPHSAPTIFWLQPGTPRFDAAQKSAEARVGPGLSVTYLAFDLRSAPPAGVRAAAPGNPFGDVRVRRALALAIDRVRLRHDAFGGEAELPSLPVAPSVLGYDPSLLPRALDLAAARELLAQTPWRAGFEVELDLRESLSRYAPPLVRDLAKLGVQLRVRQWSDPEFFARQSAGASALSVLRFSCRTGDAQEFLDKWAHSRDPERGYGESNSSYTQNPVPGLDALIEQARTGLEPTTRLRTLQRALREFAGQDLVVPLLCEHNVALSSNGALLVPRVDSFRLAYEARLAN